MDIEELLCKEVKVELENLANMEFDSEAYKATVDSIAKFADRAIAIEKLNIEQEEKEKARELEKEKFDREMEERIIARALDTELKNKQFEDEKKDRLIRNCIAVAGIVIPTAVTIWGTIVSLKFEEEGSVTTIMGRGFINKLLPRK